MSVLKHFGNEYESLESESSQIEISKELDISEENTLNTEKFRLEYIYSNLLSSPQCVGYQPKGFRQNMQLYSYQKRSLARMIERESRPETCIDPIWEKKEVDGIASYTNLTTGKTVHDSPGFYTDERSGILCETMGTGKTAICIALILHTRGQKPNPNNASPFIQTPPSSLPIDSSDSSVRSLKQLCALRIVQTQSYYHIDNLPTDVKEYLDCMPTPEFLLLDNSRRVSGRNKGPPPKSIYISHCTLVIVPNALIDQWVQEFHKFVEDGALNVLVCNKSSDMLTSHEICKDYDVVLLSHNVLRFNDKTTKNQLKNSEDEEFCLQTLREIYWLRVIVDEGHIMGVETTNQTHLASKLLSERKWVCTGTPTPNHLTNNVDQELKYLHGLLCFVKQKPWDDNKLWNKIIANPFKKKDEKALNILSTLLNRIMIRNKLDDIQKDVALPPCHVQVTKLQFKDGEALRYNQVVAQIRGNLITSRYEGKNSLFDPSNRKYAFQSLARLRESCFYYTGLNKEERDLCSEEVVKDLNFEDKTKSVLSTEEEEELKTVYSFMQVDAWIDPTEKVEESAKLTYLLKRLEEIPKEEKIIVFTQFNDTLRRLLDTFDTLEIPFLEFHTQMSPAKRSSTVTTFNTSSEVRVIFMKTELAAYGINLTAASRIFIIDPVWDLSREAQAIKRAHRIGQTRQVFVEKLVIEGTIEDQLFKDFAQENKENSGSQNVRKIQSLLQSLTFTKIDFEAVKGKYLEYRAQQQVEIKMGEMPELIEDNMLLSPKQESNVNDSPQKIRKLEMSPTIEPAKKKKKTVRFNV